jgi:hypothetical protein
VVGAPRRVGRHHRRAVLAGDRAAGEAERCHRVRLRADVRRQLLGFTGTEADSRKGERPDYELKCTAERIRLSPRPLFILILSILWGSPP